MIPLSKTTRRGLAKMLARHQSDPVSSNKITMNRTSLMPRVSDSQHGPPRRGATRRRPPRRLSMASIDRWLDRLVDIAVITALLVGTVALALHLLL